MENNVLDRVKVDNSSHPMARFNLSHDFNSTFQFGEVQPSSADFVIPNSHSSISRQTLVRLAPMLAPAFGRIKYKDWTHFIPVEDVWKQFPVFMAQGRYNSASSSNVNPKLVPHMTLGLLSYMCLVGCKMSLYKGNKLYLQSQSGYDPDVQGVGLYKCDDVEHLSQSALTFIEHISDTQYGDTSHQPFGLDVTSNAIWDVSNGPLINLKHFIAPALIGLDVPPVADVIVPSANFDSVSFFEIVDKDISELDVGLYSIITDLDSVSLDAADALIPFFVNWNSSEGYLCWAACRFSNFGKRLYKILVGLGYQLDFNSTQPVSLLPLFAFYKAWFDTFGLTRYMSYQETNFYKIREICYNTDFNDFGRIFEAGSNSPVTMNLWFRFIQDVGNAFVTENVDFVSAHTKDEFISGNVADFESSFARFAKSRLLGHDNDLSVANPGQVIDGGPLHISGDITTMSPSGEPLKHLYGSATNEVHLTGLDIKELLKAYRWVNRNTQAGKDIENILRSQGFGYYLYSCKSNFLGYSEMDINISDVVNSSDTYNASTGQGMLLGEYGGRGLGYDGSKPVSFDAKEFGFIITLSSIVPIAGYSQGVGAAQLMLDKFSFYNPEFDGCGMQLTPKSVIQGNKPWCEKDAYGELERAFGLIPMYSHMKTARNISSGGFSLRGCKDIFSRYSLDKEINVGERRVRVRPENDSGLRFSITKIFPSTYFPESGEFWRYIGKYPWLSNFDRIFARQKLEGEYLNTFFQTGSLQDFSFFWSLWSDEYFIVHQIVNHQHWSHMLPIEESFGTDDDGKFNDSIEKA